MGVAQIWVWSKYGCGPHTHLPLGVVVGVPGEVAVMPPPRYHGLPWMVASAAPPPPPPPNTINPMLFENFRLIKG